MKTAQQQLESQMEEGHKLIYKVIESKNGKRGRKITKTRTNVQDLTIQGKTVDEYVKDEGLDAKTAKKIAEIKGSVIITEEGYWENCRLHVTNIRVESAQ